MRVNIFSKDENRCEDSALLFVMGTTFTQAGSKEEENLNRFMSSVANFTALPLVMIDFQDQGFNATEFTHELAKHKDQYRSLEIFLPIHGSEMTFIGDVSILNPLVSIPLISNMLGDAVVNVPFSVPAENFMQALGYGLNYALNQEPANIWHFGCQAAKLNPMANKYLPSGTAYYTEGRGFLTHDIFLDAIIGAFSRNEPFTVSSFLEDYYKTVLIKRNDHYSKLNNPTLQIAGGLEKNAISSAQTLFEIINSKQEDSLKLKQAMVRFESVTGLALDNMIEFTQQLKLKPIPVVEFYATQWFVAATISVAIKTLSVIDYLLSFAIEDQNLLTTLYGEVEDVNTSKLGVISRFPTKIVEPNFSFCSDEIYQRSYLHWKYYDPIISPEDRAALQKGACLVSAFSLMESETGQITAEKVLPAFGLLADYYFD